VESQGIRLDRQETERVLGHLRLVIAGEILFAIIIVISLAIKWHEVPVITQIAGVLFATGIGAHGFSMVLTRYRIARRASRTVQGSILLRQKKKGGT
jgi:hypothetical protein